MHDRRTAAIAYAAAVAATAVSVAIRFAFDSWFGANVTYLQFFPAILVSAWFGGLGAGMVATACSALAAMYFFLPPAGFAVGDVRDVISLVVFSGTGCGIAWLNHRLSAAQDALTQSASVATARAERLDAIINTTVDAIIVINAKGLIEAFNRGAERMFGYQASEVLGRNVSMLMPSPDHDHHDEYLRRYIQTGQPKIIGIGREVKGRRRDGTVFPLHLSVGEMTIDNERKFTGMLHDLTHRAQLDEQLRASEARWRAIVDSAVDGIIVIDEHGRIEAFNPAAERLFGYSEADVLGRNVDMLMPSPYHEEHDRYMARYLATGRAKIIGVGREVAGLRSDGTTFPLHLSVGVITTGGERKFTGILHDLSARVQMEEQLREQAALARLGEMAGVIAHEVKNPLAGIRGAIQVIHKRLFEGAPEGKILKEIVARIDSLDDMVKELLLFARPPKPRRAPTDIGSLVSTTVGLLNQDPGLKDVVFDIQGSAPPISADAEMLRIVFQNLLINGAQSMKGRGTIHIGIGVEDAGCTIAFRDAGPGIPPDIREKIFTPFFTTKSRGTGLGLPTAKRLIEAHDGRISVDCPPAGGTTVMIQLPLQAHSAGEGATATMH